MTGFYPNLNRSTGGGIGTQITETVLSGAIGDVVSSLPLSAYVAASWIITANDVSGFSSQKIIHATVSNGVASHVEMRNGNDVKFNVDVQVNLGQLELLIDNDHGTNIVVRILEFATEV